MNAKPVAVALVLCELVVVNEKAHNITPVSCFSRRTVEGSLELMPPFYVVFTLVNGHGSATVKLVVERLDAFEVIYHRDLTLSFVDPLQELTGIFRIRSQIIKVRGHYQVILMIGEDIIAQKRFSIIHYS